MKSLWFKAAQFILAIFASVNLTLSGCASDEEDEYIFKNDPVSAYYGIIKTGGGCYEATEIYLLYEDIDCAKLNTIIPNYYGSIILSNFNKPGIYNISSSLAIDPKNREKFIANASYHGDTIYSAREGTIEVKPFNDSDKEFQIDMNLSLYPKKYANKNFNPHYYKNTITVKYCQKINTATPDIKMGKCPNEE